jgi:hypothetical protein
MEVRIIEKICPVCGYATVLAGGIDNTCIDCTLWAEKAEVAAINKKLPFGEILFEPGYMVSEEWFNSIRY